MKYFFKGWKSLPETWRNAKTGGDGDLTWRQWGSHTKRHVVTGWWVSPNTMSLGVSAGTSNKDYGEPFFFAVEIGPFQWNFVVHDAVN